MAEAKKAIPVVVVDPPLVAPVEKRPVPRAADARVGAFGAHRRSPAPTPRQAGGVPSEAAAKIQGSFRKSLLRKRAANALANFRAAAPPRKVVREPMREPVARGLGRVASAEPLHSEVAQAKAELVFATPTKAAVPPIGGKAERAAAAAAGKNGHGLGPLRGLNGGYPIGGFHGKKQQALPAIPMRADRVGFQRAPVFVR